MKRNEIRAYPAAQYTISTIRDLDNFFDTIVNNVFAIDEFDVVIPSNVISSTVILNIRDAYCYVSLEFVQQYYTKHLMNPNGRQYNFDIVENVPGVYRATAWTSE